MNIFLRSIMFATVGVAIAAPSMSVRADAAVNPPLDPLREQRPALMILGTGHFANPGRDLVNIHVDDVLESARQAEINSVVKELASFRPSYLAIEWPRTKQDALDARYRDYRGGRYQLGRSETDQLGLRLAATLGLPRVYAVDWNESPPGCDEKAFDWYAYAQSHGEQAQITALIKASSGVVPLGSLTIGQWLRQLNRPEVLAANHRNYFDIAEIGDAQQQPGANWVGSWYARNLRIFDNIVHLTSRPKDRVLVIYGQGHAYLLRQFAKESGAFRVVDADSVLRNR